jgi:hypothetical protein
MKSKQVNIWIYDRKNKKRRQVTLRIPLQERDRRKKASAIFANFIHHKGYISILLMIDHMKKMGAPLVGAKSSPFSCLSSKGIFTKQLRNK